MRKLGWNSPVFLTLSLVKVTQNYVNLENFGVCHRKQPCRRDAPPRFRHSERSCCTFDPLFPWTEAHFPPIQPDASLQNGTGSHLHAKNSNLRVSHPMVTAKHSHRQAKSQIINIPIFHLPLKPVFSSYIRYFLHNARIFPVLCYRNFWLFLFSLKNRGIGGAERLPLPLPKRSEGSRWGIGVGFGIGFGIGFGLGIAIFAMLCYTLLCLNRGSPIIFRHFALIFHFAIFDVLQYIFRYLKRHLNWFYNWLVTSNYISFHLQIAQNPFSGKILPFYEISHSITPPSAGGILPMSLLT